MVDVDEFLSRYRAICEEFGLMVHACGCCDSPFVLDTLDPLPKQLEHLREGFFDRYAPKEVRDAEYPPPTPPAPATPEQIAEWEKEDEETRSREREESIESVVKSLTLLFEEEEDD